MNFQIIYIHFRAKNYVNDSCSTVAQSRKGRLMKKTLLFSIIALLSLNAQALPKGLQPIPDRELGEIVGSREFDVVAFVNGLTRSLENLANNPEGNVNPEDVLAQIMQFTAIFGMRIENIKFDGARYDGTGQLDLRSQDGSLYSTPFPTYFETISFDMSLGGGPRVGAVEIQGLNMPGIKIEISVR